MHTMHLFSEEVKFEKQESVLEQPGEIKFENYKEGKIISADFSGPQLEQKIEEKQEIAKSSVLHQVQQQNIEFQTEESNEQKAETISAKLQQFIIIGGRTLDAISPHIYLIDSQLETHIIKTLPSAICSHSSILYKNSIYIYGGTNGKAFFNDIFIMELSTNNLFRCKIEQQMLSQMLSQRIASSMSVLDNNIIIYGGSEIEKENGEFIFLNTELYSATKNSELC